MSKPTAAMAPRFSVRFAKTRRERAGGASVVAARSVMAGTRVLSVLANGDGTPGPPGARSPRRCRAARYRRARRRPLHGVRKNRLHWLLATFAPAPRSL